MVINHISFTVSDAERSMTYFEHVFGFKRLSLGSREASAIQTVTAVADAEIIIGYLQAADLKVELVQYTAPAQREAYHPRPCDLGFSHLAVNVAGFESVIEKAAQYGAHPIGGIAEIDRGPNKGRRVVYLRDADGVTVELVEADPSATKP